MLGKTKRYLEVTWVLFKYNLIPELYRDLRTDYISNPECTCAFDVENRQTAVKLRQAFEELGPTFIKMGQTMSKRPKTVRWEDSNRVMHSSNHFIAWFGNLINPVICSLIGDNTNRKTAKNIRKAGFAIKWVINFIYEEFFWQIRAKP